MNKANTMEEPTSAFVSLFLYTIIALLFFYLGKNFDVLRDTYAQNLKEHLEKKEKGWKKKKED